MNPLCKTCTNIFDFPRCCTENLEDSVKFITHCGNYSAGHRKDIPEVKLNPQTVKTLDEDWKPHYEFGGYVPECDISGAYTITQSIIAKVADAQECACIEAIRIWARGLNPLPLCRGRPMHIDADGKITVFKSTPSLQRETISPSKVWIIISV